MAPSRTGTMGAFYFSYWPKKWSGRVQTISDDGATKFILIGPTSNISFQTVAREYEGALYKRVQKILRERAGYLVLTEPISSRQGAFLARPRLNSTFHTGTLFKPSIANRTYMHKPA
jgi:hypothetical protein